MKDCSHHIKPKRPAWDVFVRFMQSGEGQVWYQSMVEYYKTVNYNEPEKGCFKGEEF